MKKSIKKSMNSLMGILTNKTAVVTGAGGGIGKGHCLHLSRAGATVVVNDIDLDKANEVAEEILGEGNQAIVCNASIASREGAQELIDSCVGTFGKIDILVNNAGNLRDRTLLKMTDEEFDQVWVVHVKGTFWCSQIAAIAMRDQGRGGVIINTTSGAHFGSFGQTNYAAAKGAIASMTYTWALELSRYGIRVNAIAPKGNTPMTDTIKNRKITSLNIDPASNGPLVVYLCGEKAISISGQIFGSGGDRIAHMVQPHYGKTLLRKDGWDINQIEEQLLAQLRGEFGALGMLGHPYPFHDGIQSNAQEKK